jgi:hypothetical protein
MALSQSERMRIIMDEQPKYISRSKVRDSSELTVIRKARASGTEIPTSVAGIKEVDGCARNVIYRGKGTNMDYDSVLERAQFTSAFVESTFVDVGVSNRILVTPPVYDRRKEPLSQQDLSGTFINGAFVGPYTAPCRVPGFVQYFPPKRFNGKYCKFNTNVLPSG